MFFFGEKENLIIIQRKWKRDWKYSQFITKEVRLIRSESICGIKKLVYKAKLSHPIYCVFEELT